MKPIQMVDLNGQYQHIKSQVDQAIQEVITQSSFINGSAVAAFNKALAAYHKVDFAHSCGNGTDALQIALMALGLKPGDEIITPAFTYFATVEVVLLLGLKPVFVDVDPDTFNIDVSKIEAKISAKTKAIVPVHLYGQAANMETILEIAKKHNLYVVEDNAQSIGGSIRFNDGSVHPTGTLGDMSCTSFFPSKNLGCYGDGGAIITSNEALYVSVKAIANHGQQKKYFHDVVGLNSRLDTLQAAILNIKLPLLDAYNAARQKFADAYNKGFEDNPNIKTPVVLEGVTHVYHQYTIQLAQHINRDELKDALSVVGIPSMIYYPLACHQQKALLNIYPEQEAMPVSEKLSKQVLSLPIHTEMEADQLTFIIDQVNKFTSKS